MSFFPQDQIVKDKALQTMAAMSSAQLVSATVLQEKLGLSDSRYPPSTTVSVCRQGKGCQTLKTLTFETHGWHPSLMLMVSSQRLLGTGSFKGY